MLRRLLFVLFLLCVGVQAQSPRLYAPTTNDLISYVIPKSNDRLTAVLGGFATTNDANGGIFLFNTNNTAAPDWTNTFRPAVGLGLWERLQMPVGTNLAWIGGVTSYVPYFTNNTLSTTSPMVMTNGYVGIGSANPSRILDITNNVIGGTSLGLANPSANGVSYSSIDFLGGTADSHIYQFSSGWTPVGGYNASALMIEASAGRLDMAGFGGVHVYTLPVVGTEAFTVNTDGLVGITNNLVVGGTVGIGTNTPTGKFSVSNTGVRENLLVHATLQRVGVNTAGPLAALHALSPTDTITLMAQAASGQANDIFDVVNSAGNVLGGFDSLGSVYSGADLRIAGTARITSNLTNSILTGSRVVVTDANKALASSATTAADLAAIAGSASYTKGIVVSPGGGAALTTIAGTTSYVPYWTNSYASLTSPMIMTNGFVGVGTLDPTGRVEIAGSVQSAPLLQLKNTWDHISANARYSIAGYSAVAASQTNTFYITVDGTALFNTISSSPDGGVSIPTWMNQSGFFGLAANLESLTVTNDAMIRGSLTVTNKITNDVLTATRVVFSDPNKALTDDADLTFATDTLTGTKLVGSTSVSTPSSLAGALVVTNNASVGGTLLVTGNLTNSALTGSKVVVTDGDKALASSAITAAALGTIAGTTSYVPYFTNNGLSVTSPMVMTNGNVGIGTTNPDRALVVSRTGGGEIQMKSVVSGISYLLLDGYSSSVNYAANDGGGQIELRNWDTTANNYSGIAFYDAGGNGYASIKGISLSDADNSGELAFHTRPAGGGITAVMRLTTLGNVGIGTTSPRSKLHVEGDASASAGASSLYLGETGSSASRDWIIGNAASINYGDLYFMTGAAKGSTPFGTTPKVTFTNAGNVGIGTTGPLAKFAVNGGANIGADADPGDNNLNVVGTATIGSLTSGRVTYAGTSGILSDSADFLYDAANGIVTLRKDWDGLVTPLHLENRDTNATASAGVALGAYFACTDVVAPALSAGKISWLKEQEWTSDVATRDSSFNVYTKLNNTEGLKFTVSSAGYVNIPSLTASRAVVTDASQNLTNSPTTAAQVGYLHDVTGDIQAQFTGKADTGSIPVPANPTTNIGLTVVNGSEATFMRSDAAPALSVGINPEWTANHSWAASGAGVYAISVKVTGDSDYRFGIRGDGYIDWGDGTESRDVALYRSGAGYLTIQTNLGLGMTPSTQLELSTDSAQKPTTSTWAITSDKRAKENVKPYQRGLKELDRINTREYTFNGFGNTTKGARGVGVIADEIAEILPETVSTNSAGVKAFNGHELIFGVMLNAIKELSAENKELKKRLDRLEAKANP